MAVTGVVKAVGSAILSKGAKKGAEKVAKKKMSKTKKAAIGVGGVVGLKALVGQDGKPIQPGSTGISTSDANAKAMAEAGNYVGMTGDNTTLSGLQKGGVIAGGGTANYVKGAGANYLANLQPSERAQILVRLGQIPGLYAKGQAPTPDFIQKMISGGSIVPRPADFAALEQIASVAEWSGSTIGNTVVKLISQPALAQQFFGKVTTTPKAVSSSAVLGAELNDKFLDLFETKADSATINAYTKEINALESKGTVGSQQKEDILLKYIQKKAAQQYNLVEPGAIASASSKGALGRRVRSLRTAYSDNGIPIDERQIYNKSVQSLRSEEAYKNEIDSVMMQAGSVMPAFKEYFAQGKTAREVLSPWINTRARVLGISEDQIKVSDMYDVGSGTAPLSIQEYKKQLYRSEDFRKTDAFKERGLGDMKSLFRALNIG